MPTCLSDNITGHSCDPYGRLRDRHLYMFLLCEHFRETCNLPVPIVPGYSQGFEVGMH